MVRGEYTQFTDLLVIDQRSVKGDETSAAAEDHGLLDRSVLASPELKDCHQFWQYYVLTASRGQVLRLHRFVPKYPVSYEEPLASVIIQRL